MRHTVSMMHTKKRALSILGASVIAIFFVCRYGSVFASPAATTVVNMNPGFQPSPGHGDSTEIPPFSENSVRIYIGIVCSPIVNDWFDCHLLQFTATCQKCLTTLGHGMVEIFE
jgi:hypothetical protein